MVKITRFVGLDYHQESVQVCVMDSEGRVLANRSVANNWTAIRAVMQETLPADMSEVIVRAAIECCSGAAHLAEELIERAEWLVTLAHPGLVNRKARLRLPSRNDQLWCRC